MRNIVFYGAGRIAEQLCSYYENDLPTFFIDSYSDKKNLAGRPVRKLQDVDNLQDYYIVVTTFAYDDIRSLLESKGLKQEKDFCFYKDYFHIDKETLHDKLAAIKSIYPPKGILIGGPFFTGRKVSETVAFFRNYALSQNTACVFISHLTALSAEKAAAMLGGGFLSLPEFTNWQGRKREHFDIRDIADELQFIDISEEEIDLLRSIESFHCVDNEKTDLFVCIQIFKFYKYLVESLSPSKIIVGTDIKQEYAILALVARRMGIPFIFWEYGWIPGTYIFEKDGSAGRSRLANDECVINNMTNHLKLNEIERIITTILSKEEDYDISKHDRDELKQLDETKKTVFLVGTGNFLSIKGDSDFSKKYISPYYSSMEEMLDDVYEICCRNNWNLIYKPHPGLTSFEDNSKKRSGVIWIKDTDANYLIDKSDLVVTLYSAVDCMALIKGKPLLQLGRSILNYANCTYMPYTKVDIETYAQAAMENKDATHLDENFKKFLGKLLSNVCWDDMTHSEMPYGLTSDVDFFSV